MYLIYIDESGTAVKYNKDPKRFSLTACIVNEQDWNLINETIVVFKRKYFSRYDPYNIELHAKNIFHKKGIFIKELKGNRNFELLDDFYDVISPLPLVVITVVIDKKALEHKQSVNLYDVIFTPYQICWHFLIERLCKFLNKKNLEFDISGEGNQFGLLLIDNQSNKRQNRKVRITILNYIRGKKYLKIGKKVISTKYLFKEIHFLESEFYNLSQITDMIAYTVNRKYSSKNKSSKIDIYNEKYYQKIEKLFDTDVYGVIEGCGIKIYP